MSLKPKVAFWIVGLALTCLLFAEAQERERYHARLTVLPIEMGTRARLTGSGSASAVLEGRTLSLTGEFAGMQGPATTAQLHEGPKMGLRGEAIGDLSVTASAAGKITGEIELSDEQVESLKQSRIYIQIHSESAPEGNLWGWLVP